MEIFSFFKLKMKEPSNFEENKNNLGTVSLIQWQVFPAWPFKLWSWQLGVYVSALKTFV